MHYDIIKADEIYNAKKAENPDFDYMLVKSWRDEMPEQFAKRMYEEEYGCHIFDEELYNEAVGLLEWVNKAGKGAKWSVNDIVKLSGIDFDTKDYYAKDFTYIANMLWSDYCNVFTDASYYIKMSKNYLEDPDYMGDPSERAYHNAIKRIKYKENS